MRSTVDGPCEWFGWIVRMDGPDGVRESRKKQQVVCEIYYLLEISKNTITGVVCEIL